MKKTAYKEEIQLKTFTVATNLNVRQLPTMESDIVEILSEGTQISCPGETVTGDDGFEYLKVENGYCQTRFLI